MNWEKQLEAIYYNPSHPASFSGAKKLKFFLQKNGSDVSTYKIQKWLQHQEPFSLQRQVRRKFKRSPVIVQGIDDQWDADLMDMTKFSKYNDGIKFILVVIDIFSKYLWVRPLENKQGSSVEKALNDILHGNRIPNKIRTDKGQEFRSKLVESLLKKYRIKHIYAQNTEIKANYAERVIKTLKTKIYRYLTHKNNYRYIDKLQGFADSYNKTFHNTIDIEPINVTQRNEEETRVSTFLSREKHTGNPLSVSKQPYKFKIGDKVRVTHISNLFTRQYDMQWSGEIFIITKRFLRSSLPVYKLKDFNDEEIQGTFYQSELQKVDTDEDNLWKIEEILKSKGSGQNKQYFVKWLHWPSKFNSWIKASDVLSR
jgi:hypothetical protein